LRNLRHAEAFTDFGRADAPTRLLLADAQTSGGLLIAVDPERLRVLLDGLAAEETEAAAVIGHFTGSAAGRIRLV
jgi:selenophosphate synthase